MKCQSVCFLVLTFYRATALVWSPELSSDLAFLETPFVPLNEEPYEEFSVSNEPSPIQLTGDCEVYEGGLRCGSVSPAQLPVAPKSPEQQAAESPPNAPINPSPLQLATKHKMCQYNDVHIGKVYVGYCNPDGKRICKDVVENGMTIKMLAVYSGDWCDPPDSYICCIKKMMRRYPYNPYWCMSDDHTETEKSACAKSGGFLESCIQGHCPAGSRCCMHTQGGLEFNPSIMDKPIVHNPDDP